MKLLRIIVLAACAAYGAIIGGANLAQGTPMNGLLLAALSACRLSMFNSPVCSRSTVDMAIMGPAIMGVAITGAAIMGPIMGTAIMGTAIMGAAIADHCSPV